MVFGISEHFSRLFTVTQDYFKMKWKIEKTCRKGEAPRARSGHRIVYYNGQIFTFGGYNPESTAEQLFKELWKFNLITKTWQSIKITGDIPNTLASHTARFCMLEGKPTMIVYGGTGHNFGENNSNFTNLCDLSTGHWTTLGVRYEESEEIDRPAELYGQAVCLVQNRYLYTIGGTTGHFYQMDVNRLDLVTKKWKLLKKGTNGLGMLENQPHEPAARYRHEVVEFKNKLYVLGGGTAQDNDGFDVIYAFDLATNSWINKATHGDSSIPIDESIEEQYPEPRKCHTCAQNGQYVYLLGGYNNTIIFSDIWRIDLTDLQWRKMPQALEKPVYFHDSVLTDEGQVVIFGGVESVESNKRTNQVQSCYIQVPALRHLSWKSMNNFYDLHTKMPEKLKEEGIPQDLIGQLVY